jgi:hypothetical protein
MLTVERRGGSSVNSGWGRYRLVGIRVYGRSLVFYIVTRPLAVFISSVATRDMICRHYVASCRGALDRLGVHNWTPISNYLFFEDVRARYAPQPLVATKAVGVPQPCKACLRNAILCENTLWRDVQAKVP